MNQLLKTDLGQHYALPPIKLNRPYYYMAAEPNVLPLARQPMLIQVVLKHYCSSTNSSIKH